ncbi:hypothetical protein [Flexivirga alba]|uniref:Peptidase MA-like domain-containing protein n=1 Tax=Flexivirga alba TaxID=702742 RepID=A0ABW2AD88_9MICO
MEAIGRRQVIALAGVGAMSVLAGCRAVSAAPPVTPVVVPASSAPAPTLPASVVYRMGNSFIPGALAKRRDLHSLTSKWSVLVGDISLPDLQDCQMYVDTAIPMIEKLTGIHLDQKYLVMLPKTAAEYEHWSGDRGDDLGVFREPLDETWQGWVVIKCAAAIGEGRTLLEDTGYLNHVIRHELFHANTLDDGVSGYGTPKWVLEGFAEWAGATATILFPRKPPLPVLPKNAEFSREGTTFAYERSFMFVSYLVTRFGQRQAIRFYERAIDFTYDTTEQAFHAVLGISLATATKDWAAQYKKQVARLYAEILGT